MTTTSFALLLALAAAMPLPPPAARAAAGTQEKADKGPNVSGAWAIAVETAAGSGTPSVTFKQDGQKLTGTYSSQVFGEQPITGTVQGNALTFTFTAAVEGNTITVTYTGTVDGDSMKGKVSLGEIGEGTFTGKRK